MIVPNPDDSPIPTGGARYVLVVLRPTPDFAIMHEIAIMCPTIDHVTRAMHDQHAFSDEWAMMTVMALDQYQLMHEARITGANAGIVGVQGDN